jgi:hypothetical protein
MKYDKKALIQLMQEPSPAGQGDTPPPKYITMALLLSSELQIRPAKTTAEFAQSWDNAYSIVAMKQAEFLRGQCVVNLDLLCACMRRISELRALLHKNFGLIEEIMEECIESEIGECSDEYHIFISNIIWRFLVTDPEEMYAKLLSGDTLTYVDSEKNIAIEEYIEELTNSPKEFNQVYTLAVRIVERINRAIFCIQRMDPLLDLEVLEEMVEYLFGESVEEAVVCLYQRFVNVPRPGQESMENDLVRRVLNGTYLMDE